jgi:uncharacterized membrane protein
MSEQHRTFRRKDVAEIAIGACVLALPLAVTEEVWDLGRELPLLNIALIVMVSYVLIAVFVYYRFYNGSLAEDAGQFGRRVVSVYAITLLVAAACLLAIGKLPLLGEPVVAIKRTILVALTGSFLATVADSMN